jgi:hypothetical protein
MSDEVDTTLRNSLVENVALIGVAAVIAVLWTPESTIVKQPTRPATNGAAPIVAPHGHDHLQPEPSLNGKTLSFKLPFLVKPTSQTPEP